MYMSLVAPAAMSAAVQRMAARCWAESSGLSQLMVELPSVVRKPFENSPKKLPDGAICAIVE
ncbi:hypothetical protein D3C80_805370 [compost metagenome]